MKIYEQEIVNERRNMNEVSERAVLQIQGAKRVFELLLSGAN